MVSRCKYDIFLISYERVGVPRLYRQRSELYPGMAHGQTAGAPEGASPDSANSFAVGRYSPMDTTAGKQLGGLSGDRGDSYQVDEYPVQAARVPRPRRTPIYFALSGLRKG